MRRRRILVILAVAFVAAVVAVVLWPGEREPEYQGRRLSDWLADYMIAPAGSAQDVQAVTAIREIGTNGFPCYINWLDRRSYTWRTQVRHWCETHGHNPPAWIVRRLWYRGVPYQGYAQLGIAVLGESAKPLIPELCTLVGPNSRAGPDIVLRAMRYAGCDGVHEVAAISTNANFSARIRCEAIRTIAWHQAVAGWGLAKVQPCTADQFVTRAIERAAADRDIEIKTAAKEVLVQIASNGVGGNGVCGGNGK